VTNDHEAHIRSLVSRLAAEVEAALRANHAKHSKDGNHTACLTPRCVMLADLLKEAWRIT
jgi:hypothetical protein